MTVRVCSRCGSADRRRGPGQNYCYNCMSEYAAETNDRTRQHAVSHREPWSAMEDEILVDGIAQGLSYEELAVLIGRTYHAVHARLYTLRHGEVTYGTFRTTTTTTTTTVRVERICPDCNITLPCYC